MLYCYCVALLFVLSYVFIVCTVPLPPGVNPIAVDKYINDHTKYQRDALNIIYSSNILLYMFRVSSTHLRENTVVREQPMVQSLSIES